MRSAMEILQISTPDGTGIQRHIQSSRSSATAGYTYQHEQGIVAKVQSRSKILFSRWNKRKQRRLIQQQKWQPRSFLRELDNLNGDLLESGIFTQVCLKGGRSIQLHGDTSQSLYVGLLQFHERGNACHAQKTLMEVRQKFSFLKFSICGIRIHRSIYLIRALIIVPRQKESNHLETQKKEIILCNE